VASYNLLIKQGAAKELEALPLKDRRRIVTRIQTLEEEPRPKGSEKLTGQQQYRLRQGDYRILYEIDDTQHSVTVMKIGHRRDVYR
jgi:mRNA interferase RelE/StbE